MFWRLRRSRSRKNTAGGKRRRGLVVQRTMRSVVVVIESPTVNHPAGLLQAQEQFSVQQLVAQLAVEALHVAVLPRTALGDEQRLHVSPIEPRANGLGHELGTVVTPQVGRSAAHGKQVLQNPDHIVGRERARYFDR